MMSPKTEHCPQNKILKNWISLKLSTSVRPKTPRRVKKQDREWAKSFVICASDKGLMARMPTHCKPIRKDRPNCLSNILERTSFFKQDARSP